MIKKDTEVLLRIPYGLVPVLIKLIDAGSKLMEREIGGKMLDWITKLNSNRELLIVKDCPRCHYQFVQEKGKKCSSCGNPLIKRGDDYYCPMCGGSLGRNTQKV